MAYRLVQTNSTRAYQTLKAPGGTNIQSLCVKKANQYHNVLNVLQRILKSKHFCTRIQCSLWKTGPVRADFVLLVASVQEGMNDL